MEEEYLMKCVVDTAKRSFYLYSNEGDEKVVECETPEQFMDVLEVVRATCPEERLTYATPPLSKNGTSTLGDSTDYNPDSGYLPGYGPNDPPSSYI